MANNEIKINANVKDAIKEIDGLGTRVRKIGKEKQIINVDEKSAVIALKKLKSQYEDTTKAIRLMTTAMQQAVNPKTYKEFEKTIETLKKGMVAIKREYRDISGVDIGIGRGGKGGGFLDGIMSGLGKYASAAALIGIPFAAYRKQLEFAGPRLQLLGLGASRKEINAAQNSIFGYGPMENLQQAIAMRQATGSTASLGSAQLFSRFSGIGMESIIGNMGQLRQAGIGNTQSMSFLTNLYADAISKGFDESRMSDFLQAIAGYTGSMAQRGAANPETISKMVLSLMRGTQGGSEFYQANPSRALSVVQGIENVAQSGGAQGAIARRAIQSVYARHGINLSVDQLSGIVANGIQNNQFASEIQDEMGMYVVKMFNPGAKPHAGISQIKRGRGMIESSIQNFLGLGLGGGSAFLESLMGTGGTGIKTNPLDLFKKLENTLASPEMMLLKVNEDILKTLQNLSDVLIPVFKPMAQLANGASNIANFMGNDQVGWKSKLTTLEGLGLMTSPLGMLTGTGRDLIKRTKSRIFNFNKSSQASIGTNLTQGQGPDMMLGSFGRMLSWLGNPLGYNANLDQLSDPNTKAIMGSFAQRMTAMGYPVAIDPGLGGDRTVAQQMAIPSTNTRIKNPFNSKHVQHNAADWSFIDPKTGKLLKPNADNPIWNIVGQTAHELGLEWGGNWRGFKDPGHVQVTKNTPHIEQGGNIFSVFNALIAHMNQVVKKMEKHPSPTAMRAQHKINQNQ